MRINIFRKARFVGAGVGLFLLAGLTGCGVPQDQVDRQNREAFNNGYNTATVAEHKVCDTKLAQQQTQHATELKTIEAGVQARIDSEKNAAAWQGTVQGAAWGAGVASIALMGLLCLSCLAGLGLFFGHRYLMQWIEAEKADHFASFDSWDLSRNGYRAPPSVVSPKS